MVGLAYDTQSGAFYDNKPDNTGPWDARNKHCKKNYLISPYPCSYSTQTHFQRLKQLRTIHLNPWVMVPFNTSKQHIQGSENFPTKPISIPYHKGNKLCWQDKVFDPKPRCQNFFSHFYGFQGAENGPFFANKTSPAPRVCTQNLVHEFFPIPRDTMNTKSKHNQLSGP